MGFTGGSAGASSRADGNKWGPELAFQQDAWNVEVRWTSARDKTGNGNFIHFPHMIWYRFRAPIVPGRVSFGANSDETDGKFFWRGATKWQFIGSNDEDCDEKSAWTILCEDLSGSYFERRTQSKYCTVDVGKPKYKCLGISVLDSSDPNGPRVDISGIRMWERK